MEPKLQALLKLMSSGEETEQSEKPMLKLKAETQAEQLLEILEQWNKKTLFKVGDLVTLDKLFGDNYKFPLPNQPALVIESIKEPIRDMHDGHGSPTFAAPMDTRIFILHKDGELVAHWFYHKELVMWGYP